MSKILIELDAGEINYLLNLINNDLAVFPDFKNQNLRNRIEHRIYDGIKRSVIEWHPMSVKPKDQSDILVKDTNGAIFDSFAYYYENEWLIERGDKAQIVGWAYLPKE